MLLGTLRAILLGNMLACKGVICVVAKNWSRKGFQVPAQLLTNLEIQINNLKYPKFNRICTKNNLPNKLKGPQT